MDGAHNPEGARALAAYVAGLPPAKTVLLTGIMQDKAWREIVDAFCGFADDAVTVAPDNKRALPPESLRDTFIEHGVSAVSAPTLEEGWRMAREMAGENGRVVTAGSLYLVGALRSLVVGHEADGGVPGALALG